MYDFVITMLPITKRTGDSLVVGPRISTTIPVGPPGRPIDHRKALHLDKLLALIDSNRCGIRSLYGYATPQFFASEIPIFDTSGLEVPKGLFMAT